MSSPRTLPLFDERAHPASWNERMVPGEFAVHYSSFDEASRATPTCTVFATLADAEAHANQQVADRPHLRCRIYDHHGFASQPIRELSGARHQAEPEMSPRFRRWVGSVLLFLGILLTAIDWAHDFKFSWPAMVGTRLLIPGLLLLFIEAMVILYARQKGQSSTTQRSA